MSFKDLKKKSGSFEKLQAELEKTNNPVTSFADDRFWKPELDKSGNGYAVIRFLPQPTGEDLPWVRIWSHAFKGPGGWYIENSLTTLNKKDPVSEYNTELWNSGLESDKETARKQKRILKYYSNILVVNDPKHPENEGKIFLYRYGKKIFDKLTEAMSPQFEDETALNPFDFWEGANFKLKVRKVDGYWNYDKSEFEGTSAMLGGDDAKLEEVYGKLHSLKKFLEEDNFKPYDEVRSKLNRVLTGSGVQGTVEKFTPTPKTESVAPVTPPAPAAEETGEVEEDTLSYFAKLADDD
jgi:hypothetical protein